VREHEIDLGKRFHFTVSLSHRYNKEVKVDYVAAPNTAELGTDFLPAQGTLTIPADSLSAELSVLVLGDDKVECHETFSVKLSNPVNASIAKAEGLGTILNDDEPSLSIRHYIVIEGDTDRVIKLKVSLSEPACETVTCNFQTAAIIREAIPGRDYVETSGLLTFSPGETIKEIPVTIKGDTISDTLLDEDPLESFVLRLFDSTNAELLNRGNSSLIQIHDNDSEFRRSLNANLIEGETSSLHSPAAVSTIETSQQQAGLATLKVTLKAPGTQPIMIDYATADDTATAGRDYQARSGTLTFNPGETVKTVQVPILPDSTAEPNETFFLDLEVPDGVELDAAQTQFACVILNDDACPSLALAPATATLAGSNAAGSVAVTAGGGCGWSATTNVPWLKLPIGGTLGLGDGNGTLNYTLDNNATGAPRTGVITVNGITHTVTQQTTCPALTLTPAALPNGTAGQAYNQTLAQTGVPSPPAWSVSSGVLPPGLALNATTGALLGTPTRAGTFSFTIRATTSGGCTGTREYTLVIACPTLTLNPETLPNGTLGAAYNQLLATGGGTAPYSFSLSAGTLPAGMTLSLAGALSGTPTQIGAFTFTVSSVDASTCAATRSYTLNIACPTVTLAPASLPAGKVGTAYSQTLTATGGGSLNFAVSAGALPPGLSLAAATGLLAGTPTTAGTFNLTVRATSSTTCSGTQGYTLVIAALPNLASVSAANFSAQSFAPEMIVAAFGANLTTATQIANTSPLPTTLAGASVRITDSAGAERLAQLFFVSPQQINYLLPTGLAKGRAIVTVFNATELLATGNVQINDVAPGLFTANASGQGVPAANAIKLRANGEQVFLPVVQFDAQQNRFIPAPLELGAADERLFLVLFGTGLRFRSALDKVTAKIGGVDAPVFFAGAQGQFDGLDQINLEIPKALAGRGLVDVVLSVDGQSANTVQIQIK
jgi:uncharacterized protein (TIGR03437 family)